MLAEVNADRVTQHFAQPAARQVPAIPCPYSLGSVALFELREHRLYPATLLCTEERGHDLFFSPFLDFLEGAIRFNPCSLSRPLRFGLQ